METPQEERWRSKYSVPLMSIFLSFFRLDVRGDRMNIFLFESEGETSGIFIKILCMRRQMSCLWAPHMRHKHPCGAILTFNQERPWMRTVASSNRTEAWSLSHLTGVG